MFGDGQQSSIGIKKIVGGIAFASIAGFIMTWAIGQVSAAEAQAGIKSALYIPFLNGLAPGKDNLYLVGVDDGLVISTTARIKL